MIEVTDFHKAYDRTVAVRGLSFHVKRGEVLGLIGPNGAGKTTSMRAVSGMIRPSRGELRVFGCDVVADPVAAKRQLAYVPDDPQLFGDLTVDQHLAFTASAYDVRDADEKVSGLLETFELADRRTKPARDLSRGMRQKLAICCAYLHDPSALLLDEPLTGLDPHGIRVLKRTLRERADEGAAVVISSHLLAMVEDLCTHVLILSEGESRFFGTVAELKSTFMTEDDEASLERIFFMATEKSRPAPLVTVAG
ncbi:MAG: ABC transporter ATP-binding protein [Planctomycetota bacterium]|nr:MAG: ABC transporter ATP-binding protein [Planctomycetota bacterium]